MRKKIEKVLNESNEKIANISVSFSMVDMNSESSYSKFHGWIFKRIR